MYLLQGCKFKSEKVRLTEDTCRSLGETHTRDSEGQASHRWSLDPASALAFSLCVFGTRQITMLRRAV